MDNKFIRVDEVAQELSVSKPYAYKLIKKLNDELIPVAKFRRFYCWYAALRCFK